MFALSELGFDAFFEAQLKAWSAESCYPARVAAEHRGSYEVWSSDGAGLRRWLAGCIRN